MTDKKNKFADVAERVTQRRSEPETSPTLPAPGAKMARARGKKNDPNYVQVTVYLRKSVHQTAKKILIDQEREFSELVDDLVSHWTDDPKV